MAKASDFKFGMQLGFAIAHHKIPPRRKSVRSSGLLKLRKNWGSLLIFLQWLKLANLNLAYSLGLPSPIIKSHLKTKVGVAFVWGASKIAVFL